MILFLNIKCYNKIILINSEKKYYLNFHFFSIFFLFLFLITIVDIFYDNNE